MSLRRRRSWKDEDGIKLTWQLITAIEGADETRASLFPPVGANKISGGRKKSEYQFELAKTLFAEHPKYMDAFATITTAKDKKFWYSKIKNRLDAVSLIKKVRAQIEEMGQTGAGVENEEDIMPGTVLTTKWDLIKKDSPWFFHMRSLVGERPNLVHTGLGNNDSAVDMGILLSGGDRDLDDSSSLAADDAADPLTCSPDSDVPPVPTLESAKRGEKAARKRKQPSGPAAKKAPTTKPANIKDKFMATAIAEEEIAQQLLKLKQSKHEVRKEVQLEKLRLQADAKAKKNEARLDLARLKMAQEHKYRMAQMRVAASQSQAGPSSHTGAYMGGSQSQMEPYSDLPMLHTSSESGESGAESFNFSSDAVNSFDPQFGSFSYGSGSTH
ncbi:hypothetical protein C8F04DRAFT_1190431 [Mycena alexandri]|uniref:No apical meristem-associated C-terminal domain-containing protein n=1 Tax=Mycena alexandri TaxID=1745969 RepID=A0AAD6SGM5_9AGAR|nr:hypothetical protein C8F04DRAFT_1190431 [Mycena alexandri]